MARSPAPSATARPPTARPSTMATSWASICDSIDIVGSDVKQVTLDCINRMMDEEEGDALTILAGEELDDGAFQEIIDAIEEAQPDSRYRRAPRRAAPLSGHLLDRVGAIRYDGRLHRSARSGPPRAHVLPCGGRLAPQIRFRNEGGGPPQARDRACGGPSPSRSHALPRLLPHLHRRVRAARRGVHDRGHHRQGVQSPHVEAGHDRYRGVPGRCDGRAQDRVLQAAVDRRASSPSASGSP